VQISKHEAGCFNSRAVPPSPQMPLAPAPGKKIEAPAARAESLPAKAEPPPIEAEPPPAGPEPAVAHKAGRALAPPAEKDGQERAPAALGDQAWVVTLDAFSSISNVKQLRTKLSAAGVKSYTEPVKTSRGELTRVRAGPFASREAAENARAKLDAMGLKPGAVASR
jgi:DedD protein